jgi:pseudouridine-5'-phosphate glycosidase
VPPRASSHLRVLPHIRQALDAGRPVVALETSVLAQGLPIPANADAARRMVAAVESAGAVAALTAVVCGRVTLGLEPEELERFLRRENVRKVSARDLGAAVAARADGATTVAATLAIASQAGIRVMATGGIGGVHRELPGTPADRLVRDESADLLELSRSSMIVVCAGAKSILDLPATWERLDTLGIPVVGFGTREFPAFYSASSGIPLAVCVSAATEVASIASAHFALGRAQSVLVVQPPPANVALDAETVGNAVDAALDSASREGIRGADVTPYLLAAVARVMGGRTLQTNVSLLETNARLAAEIAVTLDATV